MRLLLQSPDDGWLIISRHRLMPDKIAASGKWRRRPVAAVSWTWSLLTDFPVDWSKIDREREFVSHFVGQFRRILRGTCDYKDWMREHICSALFGQIGAIQLDARALMMMIAVLLKPGLLSAHCPLGRCLDKIVFSKKAPVVFEFDSAARVSRLSAASKPSI